MELKESYLYSIHYEMADGLMNVDLIDTDFGYLLKWKNNPRVFCNVALYSKGEDKIEAKQLANDYGINHIGQYHDNSNQQPNSIPIYVRSPKSEEAPILIDYNILKFSFATRDLEIDFTKMTKLFSRLNHFNDVEKQQIERYVGGILHMLDGEIWALSDTDENIITAALLAHIDDHMISIEDVVSPNEDLSKEFTPKLVKSIISSFSEKQIYLTPRHTKLTSKLLNRLAFKTISSIVIQEI